MAAAGKPRPAWLEHHGVSVDELLRGLEPVPQEPTAEEMRPAEEAGRALWESLGWPRYVAAPMVSASDLAFRMQARRHGTELAFSPMMASTLLSEPKRESLYTDKILSTTRDGTDRPLFVQIAGNNPRTVATAGRAVEERFGQDIDALDLNFGCPQYCARRGGYGSFVLEEPEKAVAVVRALTAAVRLPVTCKIRVLPSIADTIALARRLVAAGCRVLTVHGRTRHEKGPATANCDWDSIAAIRRSVRVPVIANGGVATRFDAEMLMRVTGAHACMASESLLEDPAMFARPLIEEERRLLPPHDFWKTITPDPWDEMRQAHLALLREHRSLQRTHAKGDRRAEESGRVRARREEGLEDDDGAGGGTPAAGEDGAAAATAVDDDDGCTPAEAYCRRIGLKPPLEGEEAAARAYLRSVPVGPRVGELGRRTGPDAVSLAKEYLDLCRSHGCQIKEARNHIFKVVFGLLSTNHDVRRALDAPPPGVQAVARRERTLVTTMGKKRRSLGTLRRFFHLPFSGGGPAPPPAVASQLLVMSGAMDALRNRIDAGGWPVVAVHDQPTDPSHPPGFPLPAALGTPVEVADPSAPILDLPGVPRAAAVKALSDDGSGFWWALRDPARPRAPQAADVPPFVPGPRDGSLPAAAAASSSSSSSAAATDDDDASLAPAAPCWEDPPAETAPPGTPVAPWPGADDDAAAATFRRWPPLRCRDLQRVPGLPCGMRGDAPGLWYWRYLLDPVDAKVLRGLTAGPVTRAITAAVEAGRGLSLDVDPKDYPSPGGLSLKGLPVTADEAERPWADDPSAKRVKRARLAILAE